MSEEAPKKERKKKQKTPAKIKKEFVINTLRRASYRWPARTEALTLARVERGKYLCASCKNIYPKSETALDHVVPVVDIKEGFTTWDQYVERMFCDASGYQVLCNTCHDAKTSIEVEMRKIFRQMRKAKAEADGDDEESD